MHRRSDGSRLSFAVGDRTILLLVLVFRMRLSVLLLMVSVLLRPSMSLHPRKRTSLRPCRSLPERHQSSTMRLLVLVLANVTPVQVESLVVVASAMLKRLEPASSTCLPNPYDPCAITNMKWAVTMIEASNFHSGPHCRPSSHSLLTARMREDS